MKAILLDAYLKANLGDDLFVKIITERYPDTTFYLVNKYNNLEQEFRNLKFIKMPFIFKVIDSLANRIIGIRPILLKINKKIFKNSLGYVKIGGSIFMEHEHWKQDYNSIKNVVLSLNKNYIIGANFGPYNTQNFLQQYEFLFNYFSDICFRDFYSYNLFSKRNNVRFAPDVVFNLSMSKYKFNPDQTNPYVVFSIIDLKNRTSLNQYMSNYEEKIIDLINHFIEKKINVKLISFCEYEGDLDAINRIHKRISNTESVQIIKYENNIDEILKFFANSSLVISTRFHGMILGLISGVPTLPIIYSKKMLNVLEDMKFEGYSIEIPQ